MRDRQESIFSMIRRGKMVRLTDNTLEKLYDQYCQTGDKALLAPLCESAEVIGSYIAISHLLCIPRLQATDVDDYLQEIAEIFLKKLIRDFEKGNHEDDIVRTIRSLYKKKALTIVEREKSLRNKAWIESLDSITTDKNGRTMDRIGKCDEAFDGDADEARYQTELFHKIECMYIAAIMDYSASPPRAVSLLYARILSNLLPAMDPEEIDRRARKIAAMDTRRKTGEEQKMIDAIRRVGNYRTDTSVVWAMKKMYGKNTETLTSQSERIIHKTFDETVGWSSRFISKLSEKAEKFGNRTWGSLILTEEFQQKDFENMVYAGHYMIRKRVVKQILSDPELKKEVVVMDFFKDYTDET